MKLKVSDLLELLGSPKKNDGVGPHPKKKMKKMQQIKKQLQNYYRACLVPKNIKMKVSCISRIKTKQNNLTN